MWSRVVLEFIWEYTLPSVEDQRYHSFSRKTFTFVPGSRKEHDIFGVITFGRDKDNTIVLLDDPRVSRQHAFLQVIYHDDGPAFVFTVSGRNGMLVDNYVCYPHSSDFPSSHPVRSGSEIQIPTQFKDEERRWIIYLTITVT